MSAYKRCKTNMTDLDIVIAAIEEVKPEWHGKMLIDREGKLVPLGYQGDDRTQRTDEYHSDYATIIIPGSGSLQVGRGENVVGGASNDICVIMDTDGTYSIDISANESHVYNEAFQAEIKVNYGIAEKLYGVIDIMGMDNLQIGEKQIINTENGPQTGIPMAVRISKAELLEMQGG
jgi:hypothetical protein